MTTHFVKRQPRLTKPLELKKRPRPKRRTVQRKMVSVQARSKRREGVARIRPLQALGSLARPGVEIGRVAGFGRVDTEPKNIAQPMEGAKEVEQEIDMSLELLDAEALDTGRYQAIVIQDPFDKREITGFFHMRVGYSIQAHGNTWLLRGQYFEWPTALPNLVAAINRYTGIEATYEGAKPFTAPELAKTPWLYNSVDAVRSGAFRITVAEALSLGAYMLSGGFFFVEDAWPEIGGVCDKTAHSMVEDALAAVGKPRGKDWDYAILPRSHAIYHCYFDFEGPPGGGTRGHHKGSFYSPEDGLEGVHIGGRMVAIYSGNDYEDIWVGPRPGNPFCWPQRQYQFGVNLVVYALTQEGSITHRLMQSIK